MPSRLGVKTGVMEYEAFKKALLVSEMPVGNGTTLYPGISRELEALNVADTVKDTAVGKPKPLLEENAVPTLEISGLLDGLGNPAEGCVGEETTDDTGVGTAIVPTDNGDVSGRLLGGATHRVQMVEIDVRVTVETVVVT